MKWYHDTSSQGMHLLKLVVNNLTYYSSNITQELREKMSIALLNGRIA